MRLLGLTRHQLCGARGSWPTDNKWTCGGTSRRAYATCSRKSPECHRHKPNHGDRLSKEGSAWTHRLELQAWGHRSARKACVSAKEPTVRSRLCDGMFLKRVLKKSAPNHFTLRGSDVWIAVGALSVYVSNSGEGVVVDIFRRTTDDDPISSTFALFSEGADDGKG